MIFATIDIGSGSVKLHIAERVNDKLIPLHALEKLKLIENEFGNQVSFYVSDYTSDVPDPFIMVVPKNINTNVDVKDYIIIFDMWDEPGFGK